MRMIYNQNDQEDDVGDDDKNDDHDHITDHIQDFWPLPGGFDDNDYDQDHH